MVPDPQVADRLTAVGTALAQTNLLDGNWVDIGSAVFGLIAMGSKASRRGVTRSAVGAAFLNGAALFPFLLMMAGIVSSHALTELEHASPLTFFLAGGIGAIWVGGELLQT